MEIVPTMDEVDQKQWFVFHGNKRLLVNVYVRLHTANSLLTTEHDRTKQDSDTTTVYRAGRQLIENYARERGTAITYEFETIIPKMEKWALSRTKGRTVFQWSTSGHENRRGRDVFVAKATIR